MAFTSPKRCLDFSAQKFDAILAWTKKQWFLLAVVLAILIAKAAPSIGNKGGPLHPEITVKIAVAMIFFIIGVSLKTSKLRATVLQWRIHCTVQIFSLMFTPLIVCSLANICAAVANTILPSDDEHLLALVSLLGGVKVLSCMPSPVSSAVILTKAVGANEAAAVFNSTVGSFLGVLITPVMLLQITGTAAEVPIFDMIRGLGLQIILPIILGQSLRAIISDPDPLLKKFNVSKISSGILVMIVYTVFCETFSGTFEIEVELLLLLVLFLFFTMTMLICLVYFLAVSVFAYHLSRGDLVAIIFCSTQKSLTLGMPLLKILFGGSSHISIAVISIPLLIYHPLQILLGSCLVAPMQKW
eukprot:CAMPEP_0167754450 /NCGR_PEP_ID=MMETSP0110_2-20121227/8273_1 /TAXON_ID=629695 /ORGANISM="Gymnochlora sp., Strain CCMP2014" /LENGTH=356 /DNA_ID=CAMNT_0007640323 /DNA_START=55 /DNA_END=1122 /DNA_ORIENTATION=-